MRMRFVKSYIIHEEKSNKIPSLDVWITFYIGTKIILNYNDVNSLNFKTELNNLVQNNILSGMYYLKLVFVEYFILIF